MPIFAGVSLKYEQHCKFETAEFIHDLINQRLSPDLNNYFTLAKFSHCRQTRTIASSNLVIPPTSQKKTQQSFNILVQKFQIPLPMILETFQSGSF